MASSRTKSKKRATKKGTGWWQGALQRTSTFLERTLGGAGAMIAWTVLTLGLAGAWIWGQPRLEAAVDPNVSADMVGIEFTEFPVWIDDSLRGMLDSIVRAALEPNDAFDHTSLVRVREGLLSSGWIEEVRQVTREEADHIVVDVTFVSPFALVRDDDGQHLIDARGRMLPRTFPTDEARDTLTVIDAPHFPRPPRPGLVWEGHDLAGALAVLRMVDSRPWADQISRVAFESGGHLVLVTDIGAHIHWGQAPGQETALEPTGKLKLAYLEKAVTDSGRIDHNHKATWRFYDGVLTAERH